MSIQEGKEKKEGLNHPCTPTNTQNKHMYKLIISW